LNTNDCVWYKTSDVSRMYIAIKLAGKVKAKIETLAAETLRRLRLASYLRSDRRPWRTGYNDYRIQYLSKVINDDELLEIFRTDSPLPDRYGFRLDARVVEIPWVLSRLEQRTDSLLDAGSSLNHEFVLKASVLANKKITIVTLAPEARCYWRLGVSYVFGDLRDLDFRDGRFDTIVCISTIEHVGMDNSMYTGNVYSAQAGDTQEFLSAIKELKRILKPGGVLYVTFPFGQYENHSWFQQFDSQLVDALIAEFHPSHYSETVFRYDADGWKLSDRASCGHCQFFDVHTSKYFDRNSTIDYPPDYPAGERAVTCLELFK